MFTFRTLGRSGAGLKKPTKVIFGSKTKDVGLRECFYQQKCGYYYVLCGFTKWPKKYHSIFINYLSRTSEGSYSYNKTSLVYQLRLHPPPP